MSKTINFLKTSILSSLALAVVSTGLVKLQKQNLTAIKNNQAIDAFQEQQNLKAIVELQKKMPAFGFDNLLADWNFLQFIQYFGDGEAREQTGYPLISDYFEVAVDNDPRFINAYFSFSSANSLFAAQPEKTVALMSKVLDNISPEMPGYPFLVWTYKATDEILFLGDLEAAQNSYEQAAQWAETRDDEIGDRWAARYRQTAQFLASNPDSIQAQVSAWVMVLSNNQDLKTKQYALKKLEELGATVTYTNDGGVKVKVPDRV